MKGSHVILVIFLLAFGIFIGYLMINSWASSNFNMLFILTIPVFCIGSLLPIFGAVSIVLHDVKKLKAGENNSLYEEEI